MDKYFCQILTDGDIMAYVGSFVSDNLNKDVQIIWIANNRLKGDIVVTAVKNLTEHYVTYWDNAGFRQAYVGSPDEGLERAAEDGFRYALFIKIGTVQNQLPAQFKRYMRNDYAGEVVVGHCLDKELHGLELHPQTWLVDMDWWRTERPKYGDFGNETWEGVEYTRSESNFHDGNYTPKWIRATENTKTFRQSRQGHNLLNAGLQSETGIGVWPDYVRDSKTYLYAEIDKNQSTNRLIEIIQNHFNPNQYYVAPTEDFKIREKFDIFYHLGDVSADKETRHIRRDGFWRPQALFCTAGALTAPFLAYETGLEKGGRIGIMDNSSFSIAMSRDLLGKSVEDVITPSKWDGKNWKDFVLNQLKVDHTEWPGGTLVGMELLDAVDEAINNSEFTEWYQEYWPTFHIMYMNVDFFDFESLKRYWDRNSFPYMNRPTMEFSEWPPNEFNRVFVNFSNVFNYEPSSIFFNYHDKVDVVNQISADVHDRRTNKNPYLDIKFRGDNIFQRGEEKTICDILPWVEERRQQRELARLDQEQRELGRAQRKLARVTNFIAECNNHEHYEHILERPSEFDNWRDDVQVKTEYWRWIKANSNAPSLKIDIEFPTEAAIAEVTALLEEGVFVKHRGEEHPGWHSVCIHGQGAGYTDSPSEYPHLSPDRFGWVPEIADKCPEIRKWLRNVWPGEQYHRVRFMLLEPGGYISPHQDYDVRQLAAFNVAITNPPGVHFAMEEAGCIPWEPGDVRAIDIGRQHSVYNESDQPRIHMIVHGEWGAGIKELMCRSYDQLLEQVK